MLYGRSIGSGPTCYLAERLSQDGTPVGGVILQVCMYVCMYVYMCAAGDCAHEANNTKKKQESRACTRTIEAPFPVLLYS